MRTDDAELLRTLHDEHGGALWAYVVGLTNGDRAQAQDVVQETLLRAWRNPNVLLQTTGSARGWLFTVAKRIVIDEWRTARSRRERSTDTPPERAVADGIDQEIDRQLVAAAMQTLSAEHRAVLFECYFRGASVAQAAATLDIPTGHREIKDALRTASTEARAGGEGRCRMSGSGSDVDRYATWDGAYALGALDPDELTEFEAHLRTCAACRERVAEVLPTVGRLAVARAAGFDPDAIEQGSLAPPDTLLPGLLRRADGDRRRRRWITAALGTVAAACLIALTVVIWPSSGGAPSGPAPQAMRPLTSTPISATATLVSRAWGTEVDLKCSYTEHIEQYWPYRLVLIDNKGEAYDGGSWSLVPDHTITFTGGAAVPLANVRRVQITLPDGTPILQLKV